MISFWYHVGNPADGPDLWKRVEWPVLPRIDEIVDVSDVQGKVSEIWHFTECSSPTIWVTVNLDGFEGKSSKEEYFERLREDDRWIEQPPNI